MPSETVGYLASELARRIAYNGNYSMRSFARDLGLAPSHLSNFFNGKSGFSKNRALDIAQKLNWDQVKSNRFVKLVESEYSRAKIVKIVAKEELEILPLEMVKKGNLSEERFKFISHWYHLAILELYNLTDFKLNSEYISEKLGISKNTAEEALKRLIELKLLIKKNGRLIPSDDYTMVGDNYPSAAIRIFHNEILTKAQKAISEQDINSRILRSTFLSIKKDKQEVALKLLQEFHDNFCEVLSADEINDKKDNIYCLSTQFFKITN